MEHEQAIQHGLGYACGREDASGVATLHPDKNKSGWLEFGRAFGAGWAEYNAEKRCYMTNARDAYDRWQESGGRRIFRGVNLIKAESAFTGR